ncbi:hypothetical protein CYMTET_53142 [Cymbomonas tetramitiformis]|uniref:Uncharacterized protein n=1 Tax=Cymbomonas tetramitiformis TaxID=36881 RepID=A0AAE0BIW7_9CHLO|nr:hypothetical protein CYMTET_53142 [Cymbomonas tetramitiformis]
MGDLFVLDGVDGLDGRLTADGVYRLDGRLTVDGVDGLDGRLTVDGVDGLDGRLTADGLDRLDGRLTVDGLDGSSDHLQQQQQQRPVTEQADKMDTMMELTLAHLARRCQQGEVHLHAVMTTLLRAFTKSLLHAFRSKFTQFILFYVCACDQTMHCSREFAQNLVEQFQSGSSPNTTRLAAVSYLASFLARANFAPPNMITICLQQLGALASTMLDNLERQPVVTQEDQERQEKRMAVIGSLCQAMLYVLCYRLKHLVAAGAESQQAVRELPLRRLLLHDCQPLDRCLPAVVQEFLEHAPRMSLLTEAEARHLIEQQAEALASTERSLLIGTTSGRQQLDCFFPFDPYLLCRSSRPLCLHQCYIRWGDASTLANADDDEEEEDDEDEDEEEEGEEERSEEENEERQEMASSASTSTPTAGDMRNMLSPSPGDGFSKFSRRQQTLAPALGFAMPKPLGGYQTPQARVAGEVDWDSASPSDHNSDLLGTTPMSYMGTPMSMGTPFGEAATFGGRSFRR